MDGALKRLTQVQHPGPWLDVEGGCIRYDHVIAFSIANGDRPHKELEQVVDDLLLDLQARDGSSVEDATRELARVAVERTRQKPRKRTAKAPGRTRTSRTASSGRRKPRA